MRSTMLRAGEGVHARHQGRRELRLGADAMPARVPFAALTLLRGQHNAAKVCKRYAT